MKPTRACSRALLPLVLATGLLAVLPASPHAAPNDDVGEARGYFDKATASFALGRYAVAAENFEKAFEAKPEPALLYNAAQAHRLAGNKERALTLYQNYLRLYARAVKRAEVEAHVEELKKAIQHDKEVVTSPPATPPAAASAPVRVPAASEVPAAAAASSPSPPPRAVVPPPVAAPALVAPPPAETEERSLTQKPLFWVGVGGGVAAALVVVLVLALSGATDPSPSLGVVK